MFLIRPAITGFNKIVLNQVIHLIKFNKNQCKKSQKSTFTQCSSTDIIELNNWIYGYEVANLFYCLRCVFYNPAGIEADTNWARKGLKNLHHISAKIKKHESFQGHIGMHINARARLVLLGEVIFFFFWHRLIQHIENTLLNVMNRLERNALFVV